MKIMSNVRPFFFKVYISETEGIEGIRCEPFLIDAKSVKKRLDELDTEIKRTQESIDFKTWFATFSKFYQYSFRNNLLIVYQFPRASFVAGYQQWISRWNRYVRKGEKGIRILAPNMKMEKIIETDPITGQEIERETREIKGFRVVCVFDVSQTDQVEGKPVKFSEDIVHTKKVPTIPEIAEYSQIFIDHLKAKNIPVIYQSIEALGLAKGSTNGDSIFIRDDLSPTEGFFVLVHEYTHYVLHFIRVSEEKEVINRDTGKPEIDPQTGRVKTKLVSRVVKMADYNREVKELQAEAVIYVIGTALNLFTDENIIFRDDALRYMAFWQKEAKLIDSLSNIHKISSEILKTLDKESVPISEASL